MASSHRASLDAGPAALQPAGCAHALPAGLGRIQQYPAVAGRRLAAAACCGCCAAAGVAVYTCLLYASPMGPGTRTRAVSVRCWLCVPLPLCCWPRLPAVLGYAPYATRRPPRSATHRRAGLSSSCCCGWLCLSCCRLPCRCARAAALHLAISRTASAPAGVARFAGWRAGRVVAAGGRTPVRLLAVPRLASDRSGVPCGAQAIPLAEQTEQPAPQRLGA